MEQFFFNKWSKIGFSLYICCVLSYSLIAQATKVFPIQINQVDTTSFEIPLPTHSIDTTYLNDTLSVFLNQLHQATFYAASIDQINIERDTVWVNLFVGKAYEQFILRNGNIPISVLQQIGLPSSSWEKKIQSYQDAQQLQEVLLQYAENTAYPFARTYLNEIEIGEQHIEARLNWKLNQFITYGDLQIEGDANLRKGYLSNYLQIQEGTPFDKSKLNRIEQQLTELPFVRQKGAPKVRFKDDTATVYLFLDKKQASRFDLIFGVLPNSNPLLGRNLLVTGIGTLELYNSFGAGERIYVAFQQTRPQTQEIEGAFSYPYILNSAFGVTTAFELYKQDSSFLDVSYELGVSYDFSSRQSLQLFFNRHANRILTIDTTTILQTRVLPNNQDLQLNTWGIDYRFHNLDYRFNPRKGWQIQLRLGATNKSILPNQTITALKDGNDPTFDFTTLYDPLNLKTTQFQTQIQINRFFPIANRSSILLGIHTGRIFNEQGIFQSEAFRLGGNRTLRGFDEEVLRASTYFISTLEYRWLLTQNSSIFLFTDVAYLELVSQNEKSFQRPMGLGLGLRLDTQAGVFGISAALGRDWNNPSDFFDFRSPKIHFGYISLF